MFLNQFRSTWNVTEKLLLNATKLEWLSLPGDIQKVLIDQKSSFSFLNLTFFNWGFVNSPVELFANTTLLSLIPMDLQILFPTIKVSSEKISFDSILNVTLLSQKRPSALSMIGDMLLDFSPIPMVRYKRQILVGSHGHKLPPPPTPFDVIRQAALRAYVVVQKSGINMKLF